MVFVVKSEGIPLKLESRYEMGAVVARESCGKSDTGVGTLIGQVLKTLGRL